MKYEIRKAVSAVRPATAIVARRRTRNAAVPSWGMDRSGSAPAVSRKIAAARTIRSPSCVPRSLGRTLDAAAPSTPEVARGLAPPPVFPAASLPEPPATAAAPLSAEPEELKPPPEAVVVPVPKTAPEAFVTAARGHGARPPWPMTTVALSTVLPWLRPRIRYVPSDRRRPLIVRRIRSMFVPLWARTGKAATRPQPTCCTTTRTMPPRLTWYASVVDGRRPVRWTRGRARGPAETTFECAFA